MRGIVCSAVLLLAACTTPTQAVRVEYIDKPVIQVQSCVKASDVPSKPASLGQPPDNIQNALAIALAKISEWGRYGNRADIIMKGCSNIK